MARLLRGKDRGVEVNIHQFCNDWFSVGMPDGRTRIVSPTSLQLEDDERWRVWDAMMDGQTGTMLGEFDFDIETGRFTRRRR